MSRETPAIAACSSHNFPLVFVKERAASKKSMSDVVVASQDEPTMASVSLI